MPIENYKSKRLNSTWEDRERIPIEGVFEPCLKGWVEFWLLVIKEQNPAGGKAWAKKLMLESKGHVYWMARSLIWLEWVGHKSHEKWGQEVWTRIWGPPVWAAWQMRATEGVWSRNRLEQSSENKICYYLPTCNQSWNPPLPVRDVGRKTVLFSFRRNVPSLKAEDHSHSGTLRVRLKWGWPNPSPYPVGCCSEKTSLSLQARPSCMRKQTIKPKGYHLWVDRHDNPVTTRLPKSAGPTQSKSCCSTGQSGMLIFRAPITPSSQYQDDGIWNPDGASFPKRARPFTHRNHCLKSLILNVIDRFLEMITLS